MKNERGITTSSVIIYVIVVLVVLATLATISTYFHKQIETAIFKEKSAKNFTTFMSYFAQDIQEEGNGITNDNIKNQETAKIKFTNGNQYNYSLENKSIYKNNVKIADDVEYCSFTIDTNIPNKKSITLNFISENFNKNITFYIKEK